MAANAVQHAHRLDSHRITAMAGLILKRASTSRPSGDWNDDDFDVRADGAVVGRIFKVHACASRFALDVDTGFLVLRRSNADTRLCCHARGRHDGVCKELAARMKESPG